MMKARQESVYNIIYICLNPSKYVRFAHKQTNKCVLFSLSVNVQLLF